MSEKPSGSGSRAGRITAARDALAAAHAADPEATIRLQARLANIEAARKRERDRFDMLVLGRNRPAPAVTRLKVPGRKKKLRVETPVELDQALDRALAVRERSLVAKATPETEAAYLRAHAGSLADLRQRGVIDAGQLAYAEQIGSAADDAAADVAIGIVSYEPRIDASASGPADRLIESLSQARRAVAYTLWRARIPHPIVLDMLTGRPVGYTVAARRHRMRHGRAKQLLIRALDLWPECLDQAVVNVTRDAHEAALARLEG